MTLTDNSTGEGAAIQGGVGSDDVLRGLLAPLVQEAIEQEFARFLGAQPWERTVTRRGWRNGYKPRRLKTRVGTVELRVPKDREGRFQPSLFARYARSERALVLALLEMYVQGVSTRKVTRIVEQLCGATVSASQVSRLVRTLDTDVAAWRARALGEWAYPCLIVDAHYEKVRREGRVRATAVLWVVGVREDGYREHLGVWLGATESEASWQAVFAKLIERGLRGVRYVVADDHAGLRAALARHFPGAAHQRCQVHYLRNLLAQSPSVDRFHQVRQALRDVWDAPSREGAEVRLRAFLEQLQSQAPRLAAWLEESVEETLAVFELPTPAERLRLRTTNGIEHEHAETRRRTRVVRIFPNEESLVRLASALAMERNEHWLQRRYLLVSREAQLDRAWQRIKHSAA